MSRGPARRPGLAVFALPSAIIAAGLVLQVAGVISSVWVVFPVALVLGACAAWWYVRGLQRFHRQHADDVARLAGTGRWTQYGGQDQPDLPEGALSFPKRAPFESAVGHTFGGPVLRTRVDGRDVWTLELGVQYRTGGTVTDTGARESGPATLADPYHLVLTHLDRGFGQVEVGARGLGDAFRSDVEVGVPELDRAFTVRTESERTAREWLGDGCGADLARQGADALHGGRLRLDGRTLIWWRKGHQDLDVVDDAARLVARAAAYLPR